MLLMLLVSGGALAADPTCGEFCDLMSGQCYGQFNPFKDYLDCQRECAYWPSSAASAGNAWKGKGGNASSAAEDSLAGLLGTSSATHAPASPAFEVAGSKKKKKGAAKAGKAAPPPGFEKKTTAPPGFDDDGFAAVAPKRKGNKGKQQQQQQQQQQASKPAAARQQQAPKEEKVAPRQAAPVEEKAAAPKDIKTASVDDLLAGLGFGHLASGGSGSKSTHYKSSAGNVRL